MIDDADGFLGTLLAVEGIVDACAVINGPNGCRGYPAYLADRLLSRDASPTKRSLDELFYFGQSRIPCTYLDGDDYIAGSTAKLAAIMPLIAEKGDTLIAIINSPGASLIGDDLNRFIRQSDLAGRCIAFEDAWYSQPLSTGFDETVVAVLKWLTINRLPKVKRSVNLLGLSLYQRYWEGNVQELIHLCTLMGLYVISTWAGSTVAEIRESPSASHNLVIFPEFASKTAAWYEKEFGIPAVLSPQGAPIGFSATEAWIRTVATALNVDPGLALEYLNTQKKRAYHIISRSSHEASSIRGLTFGIRADVSWALPLMTWLYSYLNMLPVCIEIGHGGDEEQRRSVLSFLKEHHLSSVLEVSAESALPDFYFAEGIGGEHLALSGICRSYFDLSNRMYTDIEFIQRAVVGGAGSLMFLEYIFRDHMNGIYSE
ncbi:MAG: hypothetical protein LUQ50_08795 [Methanospirillum sp.]|uniref:nitrogenase component 1 n=1 Tax=Methanospirillum sp. TaxID=45200 RepID=UPI0023743119|nr:nitrogenase component 1 [Methanospirillum sp.]MDD1729155.1 hypothetical protein [Methanospirillum sp.]